MDTENTHDGAEPSPASAGPHNTDMATVRLSAANTWLQEEIKRLRLTDEERQALDYFATFCDENVVPEIWIQHAAALRGLAERTK